MSAENFGLKITYLDGQQDTFQFPPQFDRLKMAGLIERLLAASTLSLQFNDRLVVIPVSNIRSAELFPPPDRLPDVVIRDVQCYRPPEALASA